MNVNDKICLEMSSEGLKTVENTNYATHELMRPNVCIPYCQRSVGGIERDSEINTSFYQSQTKHLMHGKVTNKAGSKQ